jgi:hypothetical protein
VPGGPEKTASERPGKVHGRPEVGRRRGKPLVARRAGRLGVVVDVVVREDRDADRLGVLLDDGGHDLLGRLVQAGVDHLHAGVPQGAGDDLGAAIVTVQPGLGDHDAQRSCRGARCAHRILL